MEWYELTKRKQLTNYIISLYADLCERVALDKQTGGKLMVFIHVIIAMLLTCMLVFSKVGYMYNIYTIIWVGIIFSNYFFKGCILTRIERFMFDDSAWNGPVGLLFYPYVTQSAFINKFIQYALFMPITVIIIYKYLHDDISQVSNIIGLGLAMLLTPLLFFDAQSNLLG